MSTTRHSTHRLFWCLHRLLWLSTLLFMAAFWLRPRLALRFHVIASFALVLDLLSVGDGDKTTTQWRCICNHKRIPTLHASSWRRGGHQTWRIRQDEPIHILPTQSSEVSWSAIKKTHTSTDVLASYQPRFHTRRDAITFVGTWIPRTLVQGPEARRKQLNANNCALATFLSRVISCMPLPQSYL